MFKSVLYTNTKYYKLKINRKMTKFRVLKVYVDIVEAETKEEAETLFNYSDADEDFTLDVIELNENGEEIED